MDEHDSREHAGSRATDLIADFHARHEAWRRQGENLERLRADARAGGRCRSRRYPDHRARRHPPHHRGRAARAPACSPRNSRRSRSSQVGRPTTNRATKYRAKTFRTACCRRGAISRGSSPTCGRNSTSCTAETPAVCRAAGVRAGRGGTDARPRGGDQRRRTRRRARGHRAAVRARARGSRPNVPAAPATGPAPASSAARVAVRHAGNRPPRCGVRRHSPWRRRMVALRRVGAEDACADGRLDSARRARQTGVAGRSSSDDQRDARRCALGGPGSCGDLRSRRAPAADPRGGGPEIPVASAGKSDTIRSQTPSDGRYVALRPCQTSDCQILARIPPRPRRAPSHSARRRRTASRAAPRPRSPPRPGPGCRIQMMLGDAAQELLDERRTRTIGARRQVVHQRRRDRQLRA